MLLLLDNIINKMDLVDIYKILDPNTKNQTFVSEAYGTFFKTVHKLGD